MITFLIMLAIIALIAGAIARLLVPGRDPMSIGGTMLLGVVGSFVGGFIGWALFGKDLEEGALQASGLIGSIVGAVIVLLIYNATSSRSAHRRRSLV